MRGVVVVAVMAAGCGRHAASTGTSLSSTKLRDLACQLGADENVTIDVTLVDMDGKPVQRLPGVVSLEVELDGGTNMMCKAVTSVESNALDEKGHIRVATLATHVNGGPCNRELLAAQFSGAASWHVRASYMGSSTESTLEVPAFVPSRKP